MSYLVLARKYRPQSFEDLVGQEHVAKTLANAIEQNRVAHAFLFTGVRGVGKTTSARLLAKCLNCLGKDGKATGPTAVPCNACNACKEIAAGMDMDVQEIDGASYNGIDDIRRLQEGVAFRPARDRYKIYIVDEVHMLSTAAWNAFLKTLEEPPPHVKFIFATTEVQKVPVTILSRCQRYDFKLIATQTIAKRLKEVLAAESIKAEDTAVSVLAREAAGSMRDAMSLLDQVIAFSGKDLKADDVSRVLGVADRKVLHELGAALVQCEPGRVLEIIDGMAKQGFDMGHVAKDVLHHLRNLVVAKVTPGARDLLDLADEEAADVEATVQNADLDDLLRLFQGFSKAFEDIMELGHVRASLEMTLVRLAHRPPLRPIDELLVRLGDLEKRLSSGAPAPSRAGSSRQRSQEGGKPDFTSTLTSPGIERPPPKPPSSLPSDMKPRSSAAPAIASIPQEEATPLPPSVQQLSKPTEAPVVQLVPAVSGEALDRFRAIVVAIRVVRPHLASLLEHAYVIEIGAERLRLGFEQGHFAADQVALPAERAVLDREARGVLGPNVQISIETNVRPTQRSSTLAAVDKEKRDSDTAKARAEVESHPIVRKVIDLFGAEIRDIKIPDPE